MRNRRMLFVIAVMVLLPLAPTFAQQRGGQRGDAQQTVQPPAASAGQAQAREVAPVVDRKPSQTSHSVRIDGRDIKYTATAGTLPIRLDDGKVSAQMFFVAYTKDGEDPKTRPVSFVYNGGPGSASVWLHMGSFAPKKAQMADEGFQPAPPYQLVDNEYLAHRRVRRGLRRRHQHRVQPRDRRRERRAVPRTGRRHSRLRRVHRRVPEGLQPLAVAEVPHRRELRHDPLCRPVGRTAVAPRHRAERHRAGVRPDHIPDAVAGAEQRCGVRGADRDVRRDSVVPQEAAGRHAAEDHQAGGG